MRTLSQALLLSIAGAAAGASQAGTVTVNFQQPDRYVDAGSTPWDEAANLRELSSFLQALGTRHLPAGQVLNIEVLDVDLAGDTKLARLRGADLRVLKGRADWPRISMRWSLQADGRVLKSGEEQLSDMNYLGRVGARRYDGNLQHEKRMLEEWVRTRFIAP